MPRQNLFLLMGQYLHVICAESYLRLYVSPTVIGPILLLELIYSQLHRTDVTGDKSSL